MKQVIVGIAGGSGSGKTTFSNLLVNELHDYNVEVVRTDQYFKKVLPKIKSPLSDIEYDDFNHPSSLNYEKLLEDINGLLKKTNKADVVIIEGTFSLYFEEIRDLLDLKLFVDLDSDERMYRRIKRNIVQMGWSMEEIVDYYLQAAKHREREFALPTKKFAEFILNGNRLEGNAKNVIGCWIHKSINKM